MSEMTHHEKSNTTAAIDDSVRYRLLADEERRLVIETLCDASGGFSLSELTDEVVQRASYDEASAPERVRIRLHHAHLPMLDESGVIDYDPEELQVDVHRSIRDLPV